MPLFEIPTSTASQLTAYLTGQLGDPGTQTLLIVVASLPVIFWLIKRIVSLFPKSK